MSFKDIDLSFNRTYSGIGTLDGDDAVIQLVNDAVKTHFGEELYDSETGSYTMNYAQGTRNSFTLNNIRDEIYFALVGLQALKITTSDILVTKDDEKRRFVARIAFTLIDDNRTIKTQMIFNYNK